MLRFRWSMLVASFLLSVTPTGDLFAQLRASPTPPEPSRGRVGLLGAIREIRDERFNRANPPPPSATAKPNTNPTANKPSSPPNPNVAGNRVPSQQPGRNNANQPLATNPTRPSPIYNGNAGTNPLTPNRINGSSTTSVSNTPQRYPSPFQEAPVQGASFANPVNLSLPPNPSPVVAAAAVVPNRLPYTGPGVVIRLPSGLNAEVNYLLDNVEQVVIHPGEEHRLRMKGKYEIRFSRGTTDDQRSLGEAYYLLKEGVYEFSISDNGWDLHREPLPEANKKEPTPQTMVLPNPFDASHALEARPAEISKRSFNSVQAEPAAEETLPAPPPEPTAGK